MEMHSVCQASLDSLLSQICQVRPIARKVAGKINSSLVEQAASLN
jgi:hypothetical protein